MPAKKTTSCFLFLMLFISIAVFAGKTGTCPAASIAKTYHKAVNGLCKFKSCKGHLQHKNTIKLENKSESENNGTASSFDTFIAPFIRTVAPHFYEQILRKDHEKLPEAFKYKEA